MDCLTYRDKAFEDIMNEFIILLRPYPTVQSCLAGLNSRFVEGLPAVPVEGMLNYLSGLLIGSPSPEFVENPEIVEVVKGST